MKKWLKQFFLIGSIGYVLLCVLMFFGQEHMLFHPWELERNHVYEFSSTNFEEHFIKANDGEELNAVVFKVDSGESKGVVIFHHGNTGNIQACGHHYKEFINRGYDCVIWDYRSYGKTPGPLNEDKFYSDALEIYDWVKSSYAEKDITLFGQSLGTGFATYTAANRNPKQLILEAPYYSIQDLGTSKYPMFPAFIVRYPLRTDLHMGNVSCPVTMFHGTNDQTIYWESSQKLKKLNENAIFIKIKGATHNNIEKQPEFQNMMDELLP